MHPVKEFHQALLDGSYAGILELLACETPGYSASLQPEQCSFRDFEATYITLFQLGRRGRPLISLNAGDYGEIDKEQEYPAAGRPELLLQYADRYRYFGLKINEGDGAIELSDHLACQLEFMAWLGQLEVWAQDNLELQKGYQRAQRDFLQRRLQPFLEQLLNNLQRQACCEGGSFYLALMAMALGVSDRLWRQLETAVGMAPARDSFVQTTTANLWG